MSISVPKPTLAELLARIYQYFPPGIAGDDARHRVSDETRRLVCAQEAAAKRCQRNFYEIPPQQRVSLDAEAQAVIDALQAWRPFRERWIQELPHYPLRDESNPWHDSSYRYAAVRSDYGGGSGEWPDAVTCSVSILAPVYVIYTYGPEANDITDVCFSGFASRYQERVAQFDERMTDMFGFYRLDEDILLHTVPDMVPVAANRMLGEASVIDCLFSCCLW